MDIGEKLHVNSRAEWRAWLEAHHQQKPEIWLVLYKVSSGKQALALPDAVEEALCFGWIDSQMKSIDTECHAQRFSPRRKKSVWTAINRGRALRLLREGKMAPAGIAALPPEILEAWEQTSGAGS